MIEGWRELQTVSLWLVGISALLLHITLSVVLVSASALSSVALHRLAGELGRRYAFVAWLDNQGSPYFLAVALLRRLGLLGGSLAVVAALATSLESFPAAIGLAAGVVALVLLLEFGLARTLALWDPRATLRHTAWLVRVAYLVLFPVAVPLGALMRRVENKSGNGDEREEEDEEVEAFIEVGQREGILEESEGRMMRSIVDLDETSVREIMTPRTDIVALPVTATVAEAREVARAAAHSRLPVFRDTIDEVVGVLHVRDLLRAWSDRRENETVEGYVREGMFVPETRSVAALLADMRLRTQIALVVDEYGGIAGLVTLEDLLEEIVGDIRDEHDLEETLVREEPDGTWIINAAAHVDALTELFGIDFGERDFDTVGGLVVSQLGRVPAQGERLTIRNLQIEIVDADPRRIYRVRVRPHGTSHDALAAR